FPARGAEDELLRLVGEMARLPAGPPDAPARLTAEAGATVVWVSDFLEGPPLPELFSWAGGLAEEGGTLVGVHVQVPEEHELVGFGFASSAALLDRTALAPADLEEATGRHVEALRRAFAAAGLAFAAVSGAMLGQAAAEELD